MHPKYGHRTSSFVGNKTSINSELNCEQLRCAPYYCYREETYDGQNERIVYYFHQPLFRHMLEVTPERLLLDRSKTLP